MRTATRVLLILGLLICAEEVRSQTLQYQPEDMVVHLRVNTVLASDGTPTITLSWPADTAAQSYSIFRKTKMEGIFSLAGVVSVPGTSTSWTDQSAESGVAYEYRVLRDAVRKSHYDEDKKVDVLYRYYSTGYCVAGSNMLPQPNYTVLILVDSTLIDSLQPEITTLSEDMALEGWNVVVRTAPRAEQFSPDKVERTRTIIKDEYKANKNQLGATLLLGRIAVPYSGTQSPPDGHVQGSGDHQGAWPADGIYGDISGFYTDNTLTVANTSRPANDQKPGDGKYDQLTFNGDVKVAIGRVDCYNLPEMDGSELTLIKRYLAKNHDYRSGKVTTYNSCVIDDNFNSYGEWFSSTAWRSFSSTSDAPPSRGEFFSKPPSGDAWLAAYACGGGSDNSAGGVGTTADVATNGVNAVFTQTFGSFFGDYDTQNNLLRGIVASKGYTLTTVWAGRPAWYMHHMMAGETMGYSTLISQNSSSIVNSELGSYFTVVFVNGQQLSLYSTGDRQTHIALLGDPTLRIDRVAGAQPLTALEYFEQDNDVKLSWPSVPNASGYMVYVQRGEGARMTILTADPTSQLSYTDKSAISGVNVYYIQPVYLDTTNQGSFYNYGPKTSITYTKTTGIEEHIATGAQVSAYPNPATSDVTFSCNTIAGGMCSFEFVNSAGEIVRRIQHGLVTEGHQSISVPVATLPTGTYSVRMRIGDSVMTTTVVKI